MDFTLPKSLLLALCLSGAAFSANAAGETDAAVKREMRSAWVATVWQLDWPKTIITSTGNTAQINSQKKELITLLDSMSVNNMNAVNFQVRSRCDAMYRSSYEPWSTDLVETRGMDPGYDPLEFCVQECHKRGMECHAWINPYRFESVAGQWAGMPGDYASTNPDMVQDAVGGARILEPANPAVIKRICDITREIVSNYDIDGLLFDDYFYLQGIKDQDAKWYADYQEAGGTLSLADWRRDNVNRMIAAVYATVKEVKPWVRFGVSPAGIACTDPAVARKYGISGCPTGSDWQYSGIFSDPIAWISKGSLDFISPQIYWTIGNSTDYDKAAKWWSEVADKFNCHFYSSHSISSLTKNSKSPALSGLEQNLSFASGPNNNTFEEYANEVRLNRQYTLNNAPGSIFYSAKYLYSVAPLFAHYLRTTVFTNPALVPELSRQAVAPVGLVRGLALDGQTLSWTAMDNMRYTVYAVPDNVQTANFTRQPEYLLGISYSNSYSVPEEFLTGYNLAVCALDRYGYEYSPVFVGAEISTLPEATLISPVKGEIIEIPFDFKWSDVPGASHYILSIATDPEMKSLVYSREVNSTSLAANSIPGLPLDVNLYWQVTACGTNADNTPSAVEPFISRNLIVTTPADGTGEVPLSPTITWSYPDRNVTVLIASEPDFASYSMIWEKENVTGSVTVPEYVLATNRTYFVKLLYQHNGLDCVSPVSQFTTLLMEPEVPAIKHPADGGTLHADQYLVAAPTHGLQNVRIEMSASTSFSARASYITSADPTTNWTDTKVADNIKVSSKYLVDGTTYYLRIRGQYMSEDGTVNTAYSPVTSFVYSSEPAGVDDITAGNDSCALSFDGSVLRVNSASGTQVTVVNIAGASVVTFSTADVSEVSLAHLPAGVYVAYMPGSAPLKIVKK